MSNKIKLGWGRRDVTPPPSLPYRRTDVYENFRRGSRSPYGNRIDH